jgi:hypothetical protein
MESSRVCVADDQQAGLTRESTALPLIPSLMPGWTTEDSVRLLLNRCVEMKWKTVGTTAFGERNHSSLINTLENWDGEYPEWIRIFHYEAGDFADIADRFHVIEQPPRHSHRRSMPRSTLFFEGGLCN